MGKKKKNKGKKIGERKAKLQKQTPVLQRAETTKEEVALERSNEYFWRKFRWPLIGIGVFAVVSGVLVGGYFGFRVFAEGGALLNSRVVGISVALMSRQEVLEKLQNELEKYEKLSVGVSLGKRNEKLSFEELGIKADLTKTAGKMTYLGEKVGVAAVLKSLVLINDRDVEFVIDHKKAGEKLEEVFGLDGLRAKNAAIFLNEEKQIMVMSERSGKKMNYERFVQNLESQLGRLEQVAVKLELETEEPTIVKEDVEKEKHRLEESMKRIVKLKKDDNVWEVSLMDRLEWVRFEREQEHRLQASETAARGMAFKVDLVDSLVEGYLSQEVVPKVGLPMVGVKIGKDDGGNIVFDGLPQNGRELEVEKAIEMMEKAVNEGTPEVDLPVKEIKAEVEVKDSSLKDLGIKNLLATGYTTYYGSPYNRQHNIGVGISRYNGEIIPSGEKFSFNAHLGEVSAKTGFRPELVIKGDETIPEYGGGLCQVSTTFYRAALYSGLPIEQRSPHSYAVGYYAQVGGHGLDATIYPDAGKDVVILNDTPGPVLIQSYAVDGQAYFHFYGTDDGRRVKMDGPYISNYHGPGPAKIEETTSLPAGTKKQVESPHNGFDAVWYRYLYKPDGTEQKETILSKYRAVPAKYVVGKDPVAEVPVQ